MSIEKIGGNNIISKKPETEPSLFSENGDLKKSDTTDSQLTKQEKGEGLVYPDFSSFKKLLYALLDAGDYDGLRNYGLRINYMDRPLEVEPLRETVELKIAQKIVDCCLDFYVFHYNRNHDIDPEKLINDEVMEAFKMIERELGVRHLLESGFLRLINSHNLERRVDIIKELSDDFEPFSTVFIMAKMTMEDASYTDKAKARIKETVNLLIPLINEEIKSSIEKSWSDLLTADYPFLKEKRSNSNSFLLIFGLAKNISEENSIPGWRIDYGGTENILNRQSAYYLGEMYDYDTVKKMAGFGVFEEGIMKEDFEEENLIVNSPVGLLNRELLHTILLSKGNDHLRSVAVENIDKFKDANLHDFEECIIDAESFVFFLENYPELLQNMNKVDKEAFFDLLGLGESDLAMKHRKVFDLEDVDIIPESIESFLYHFDLENHPDIPVQRVYFAKSLTEILPEMNNLSKESADILIEHHQSQGVLDNLDSFLPECRQEIAATARKNLNRDKDYFLRLEKKAEKKINKDNFVDTVAISDEPLF